MLKDGLIIKILVVLLVESCLSHSLRPFCMVGAPESDGESYSTKTFTSKQIIVFPSLFQGLVLIVPQKYCQEIASNVWGFCKNWQPFPFIIVSGRYLLFLAANPSPNEVHSKEIMVWMLLQKLGLFYPCIFLRFYIR